MLHVEFAALVVMLLWIAFWRMPVPWRSNMINVLVLRKLIWIEAQIRGVPVKQIGEELSTDIANITAAERGRPWFAPRYWEDPRYF